MTGRVLVTGASRGIGAAVARILLDRGGAVVGVGRDARALAQGRGLQPLVADLSQPGVADSVVAEAIARLGGLDGLVCAAGQVVYEAAPDIPEASFRRLWELNFLAPVLLTQAFARQVPTGSVVLVSSTLSIRPAPRTLAYAASKAALDAATRGLAQELAPRIRVNAVLPGVVDTDMVRSARSPEELASLAQIHPLGRLGTADEVAALIVQILDTPWMTGSQVVLDGGLSV